MIYSIDYWEIELHVLKKWLNSWIFTNFKMVLIHEFSIYCLRWHNQSNIQHSFVRTCGKVGSKVCGKQQLRRPCDGMWVLLIPVVLRNAGFWRWRAGGVGCVSRLGGAAHFAVSARSYHQLACRCNRQKHFRTCMFAFRTDVWRPIPKPTFYDTTDRRCEPHMLSQNTGSGWLVYCDVCWQVVKARLCVDTSARSWRATWLA